jgi:hypothetical protein
VVSSAHCASRDALTPLRGALDRAEWERLWQDDWVSPALADPEQAFRTENLPPEADRERLAPTASEFERGFDQMHDLGPAVAVFGSARFGDSTPEYRLGAELGRELAEFGFTVITGGGPGGSILHEKPWK